MGSPNVCTSKPFTVSRLAEADSPYGPAPMIATSHAVIIRSLACSEFWAKSENQDSFLPSQRNYAPTAEKAHEVAGRAFGGRFPECRDCGSGRSNSWRRVSAPWREKSLAPGPSTNARIRNLEYRHEWPSSGFQEPIPSKRSVPADKGRFRRP